jgi:hypothetical protein
MPALGYLGGTDGGGATAAPGGVATFTLGVEGMTAVDQQVNWTASVAPGSDLVAEPAAGSTSVAGESRVTQTVNVQIPQDAPDGQYLVTFTLQTATGVSLPHVVALIEVD